MRVFKTKPFVRFARREGIDDAALCDAVRRAEQGVVEADLGGGVIKHRIARPGQGRARGLRSIGTVSAGTSGRSSSMGSRSAARPLSGQTNSRPSRPSQPRWWAWTMPRGQPQWPTARSREVRDDGETIQE
jgi:hypothetical protein